MKDKGKSVKSEPNILSNSNYFQPSYDLPCRKHPSNSSSVGICAFCLNEKLIELACSDCVEPRLSSCSLDIGSIGRISFMSENQKVIINNNDNNGDEPKTEKLKQSETGEVVLLRRSNSCVMDVKKNNGFWRIGRFFNKNKEKEEFYERNNGSIACSSAKISDFNESESRKSGLMDLKSRIYVKESNYYGIDNGNGNDDDEFIDLKIDLPNKSKTEYSVLKKYDPLSGDFGSLSGRVMANEEGIKKVKSSHVKGWKWIFKNHYGKNDFNHIFES